MRRGTFVHYLGLVIIICAFYLDARTVEKILSTPDFKIAESTLLGTILGVCNSAAFGVVVSFYFGRSSDSDRKTELLASATPAPLPNAAGTGGNTDGGDHGA